jgi:hypothetical protein
VPKKSPPVNFRIQQMLAEVRTLAEADLTSSWANLVEAS